MLTVFNPINRLEGKVLCSYCGIDVIYKINQLYNINYYEYKFNDLLKYIIDTFEKFLFRSITNINDIVNAHSNAKLIITKFLKLLFNDNNLYLSGGLSRLILYSLFKYNNEFDNKHNIDFSIDLFFHKNNIFMNSYHKSHADIDFYIHYDYYIDNLELFNNNFAIMKNTANMKVIEKGEYNKTTAIPKIHKVYTIKHDYSWIINSIDIIIIEKNYTIKQIVNDFDFDICSTYISNEIIYIKNLNDLVENKCKKYNYYICNIWLYNQLKFLNIHNNYNNSSNLFKECLNFYKNIYFPFYKRIYRNNVCFCKKICSYYARLHYVQGICYSNVINNEYEIDNNMYFVQKPITLCCHIKRFKKFPVIIFNKYTNKIHIGMETEIFYKFNNLFDNERINKIINDLPLINKDYFIKNIEFHFIKFLESNIFVPFKYDIFTLFGRYISKDDKDILNDGISFNANDILYFTYKDAIKYNNTQLLMEKYDALNLNMNTNLTYESYNIIYDTINDNKILKLKKIFYMSTICQYYNRIEQSINKQIIRFKKYSIKYNTDLKTCFKTLWEPYFISSEKSNSISLFNELELDKFEYYLCAGYNKELKKNVINIIYN